MENVDCDELLGEIDRLEEISMQKREQLQLLNNQLEHSHIQNDLCTTWLFIL